MNKQLIEIGAAWIGAAIQRVGAKVDFEVLSLPGGSLIAVLFWLCASVNPIRRAATQAEKRAVARRNPLACTELCDRVN